MRAPLRFLRRFVIWLDQGLALLLTGSPDLTLSALAWLRGEIQYRPGWRLVRRIVDLIFRLFGERDHCAVAWEAEISLEQWPADARAAALAELERRSLARIAALPIDAPE